ncbi:transposon Tf2-1 polyprotein isoform X1 [Spinacia oleracea]|uniref:Transposon Tf2-1 polyprotein isoform X1 n=1 Tax=Spinacia oleracea TaxID=3562 RepID=A0ABM3RLH4_SPIOL|nr:transposon Tf2-1 polyprotein isoform X1 [Spinacia oleracea]
MQEGHPLAFISRALGPKWQKLSVYEKELLAIVFVVQKWEQYLMGNHFLIKTDQKSLKWLLQQKISTPFQQFWLSKLMGFDYEIQYKSGRENLAADALSRVQGSEVLCMAMSVVDSNLATLITASYQLDATLKAIVDSLEQQQLVVGYQLQHGILRKNNRMVVGPDQELRHKIITWQHASPEGGHSGRELTLKRIKALFTWKGLSKEVRTFVRNCVTCQAAKHDTSAYPGLLQPLPIPEEVWVDVSMDFISGLPKSGGKDVIFVVVDRLSKYAHFIALSHPYTAVQVAQCYLDNVFKHHGWPRSIVSDRDSVFLSNFWQGLFSLQGIDFLLSSAYHPQTDGQTEVVNRCLEAYLRCMTGEHPNSWHMWLPLAEWWYNTHFHTATQLTPYEVVYNQPPPIHLPYLPNESNNAEIDRSLLRRETMIQTLKYHLTTAQERMKVQADRHRSEREFAVGDWVWLKLQAYRQQSLHKRSNQKLALQFYGPFQVLAKVWSVAYKLKLLSDAKIHDTFHVSQLKSFHGTLPIAAHIPPWFQGSAPETDLVQPASILQKRVVKFQNAPQVQYLVSWIGFEDYEATWEVAVDFEARFPHFVVQT